jgi:hypothetical protein
VQNSTITSNSSGALRWGDRLITPAEMDPFWYETARFPSNTANGTGAGDGGGGIGRIRVTAGSITISNSIVSANHHATKLPTSSPVPPTTINLNLQRHWYSNGFVMSATSGNNLPFGTDLMLGHLANNGGPTQKHASPGRQPPHQRRIRLADPQLISPPISAAFRASLASALTSARLSTSYPEISTLTALSPSPTSSPSPPTSTKPTPPTPTGDTNYDHRLHRRLHRTRRPLRPIASHRRRCSSTTGRPFNHTRYPLLRHPPHPLPSRKAPSPPPTSPLPL